MRYRKLPGHRRGLIQGSSVWMGTDHLLLVRSARFREDYKRFHLRDIQAIVVARAARFHISTRDLAVGALWLAAYLLSGRLAAWAPALLWVAAAGLVGAWVYVSAARSCWCRIHTAVSSDRLPSVYRTWTARRFLAAVEPRIREVQGAIESNWVEAVEHREVGPAAGHAGGGPAAAAAKLPVRARTAASDLLIASLLAGAAINLASLYSTSPVIQWSGYLVDLAQVGGAVAVFVHYHRRILGAGMQGLAIAALMALGGFYYVRQIMSSVAASATQVAPDLRVLAGNPAYVLIQKIDCGVSLLLGLAGIAVVLAARPARVD